MGDSPQVSEHSSSISQGEAVARTLRKLREWRILNLTKAQDYESWEQGLSDLTVPELRRGLEAVRSHKGWFDLRVFYCLCRGTHATFPNPDSAWDEACRSISSAEHKWSHPAVWRARSETGYFSIKTARGDAVTQVMRRFLKAYDEACKLYSESPYDAPEVLLIEQKEPVYDEQVNREGLEKARAIFT